MTAVHNFHRFGILTVYIKTAEYISQVHPKIYYYLLTVDNKHCFAVKLQKTSPDLPSSWG